MSEEKRHGGVSFFDRQTAVCPRCYLPPFPSSPSNLPWRGCRQHSTWPQRRSETRSMPRGAATTRTKMTMTKTPTPTKRRSEMPPRKQQLLRSLHLRLQPALRSPCGRPALGGRAVGRPPSRSRAWSFFWKGARKKKRRRRKKTVMVATQIDSLVPPLRERREKFQAHGSPTTPPPLRPINYTLFQDGRRPAPQAAGPARDQDDAQRRGAAPGPAHRLQLAANSCWLRTRCGARRGGVRDAVRYRVCARGTWCTAAAGE